MGADEGELREYLKERYPGAFRGSFNRYRTKGALANMLERARELYRFVGKSETCPKCNALMDEREVKKEGPNKGKKFLGCTRYPDCNGSIWDYDG